MDKKILIKLGTRIREKRKSLGLSQELLAEKANIDRSYMGGIERGERNITFLILCKICQALEIDIASITKNLPE
jgi:transcriptional regulator with XRE-family HTH domain